MKLKKMAAILLSLTLSLTSANIAFSTESDSETSGLSTESDTETSGSAIEDDDTASGSAIEDDDTASDSAIDYNYVVDDYYTGAASGVFSAGETIYSDSSIAFTASQALDVFSVSAAIDDTTFEYALKSTGIITKVSIDDASAANHRIFGYVVTTDDNEVTIVINIPSGKKGYIATTTDETAFTTVFSDTTGNGWQSVTFDTTAGTKYYILGSGTNLEVAALYAAYTSSDDDTESTTEEEDSTEATSEAEEDTEATSEEADDNTEATTETEDSTKGTTEEDGTAIEGFAIDGTSNIFKGYDTSRYSTKVTDSSVTLSVIKSATGKLSTSEDNMLYYGGEVDENYDFTLSGTVKVNNLNNLGSSTPQQTGFGIAVLDETYNKDDTPKVTSGAFGTFYMSGSSAETASLIYRSRTNNDEGTKGATVTVEKELAAGLPITVTSGTDTYEMTLTKTGQLVTITIDGESFTKEFTKDELSGTVYPMFFVARDADITITNLKFVLEKAATEEESTEATSEAEDDTEATSEEEDSTEATTEAEDDTEATTSNADDDTASDSAIDYNYVVDDNYTGIASGVFSAGETIYSDSSIAFTASQALDVVEAGSATIGDMAFTYALKSKSVNTIVSIDGEAAKNHRILGYITTTADNEVTLAMKVASNKKGYIAITEDEEIAEGTVFTTVFSDTVGNGWQNVTFDTTAGTKYYILGNAINLEVAALYVAHTTSDDDTGSTTEAEDSTETTSEADDNTEATSEDVDDSTETTTETTTEFTTVEPPTVNTDDYSVDVSDSGSGSTGGVISSYTGEETVVKIPEEVETEDGETVEITEIGAAAFKDSGIEEIIIPETVKKIADDAFEGLEDLTIFCDICSKYTLEYAEEKGIEVSILGDSTDNGRLTAADAAVVLRYTRIEDTSKFGENGYKNVVYALNSAGIEATSKILAKVRNKDFKLAANQ